MATERPEDAVAAGQASSSSFPIVALGASAGGLAAVTHLLRRLGDKPGFAVVLIQHLDPSYASNLVELLSKVTPMSVEAVEDGAVVRVDHVYVIPPGAEMTVARGVLHLTPRSHGPSPHLPIDAFFDSLAWDRGAGAVGVVLSGTASDGSRGVQAIKAEGGITLAQEGAEHPGMPESAIATGCVDFALPIEEIAAELTRIGAHLPRTQGVRDDTRPEDEAFNRILASMKARTGADFGHYRPTTLRRRMQRRAVLRRVGSLREYADLLVTDPSEAETLSEEVLIHVTSFFRDAHVFEALKRDVFPRLLASGPRDAIRVWVPGCSSGEEVYSIAICLSEFLAEAGASQVQVRMFGTDVSRRAIERARAGIYAEGVTETVGPGRLARFFTKTERGYEILKEVRDRCVFATHDIGRDPPFSKMDLISCRNLMIYLDPTLQQRVLPMFHYALNEPGFLVLGTAETVGSFVGFATSDAKNKIFVRTPGAARLGFDFGNVRGWSAPSHAFTRPVERAPSVGDVRKDADRAVLAAIAPAGVVVTDDLAIVEFRGEIAPYLEPIPGVATLDLLRMAREELRIALRRTIDEARASGKPARSPGLILSGTDRRCVDLDVIPFTVAPTPARFFVVLFTERVAPANLGPAPTEDHARVAVEDALRQELGSARAYLQSVIEQLEAGNEELKAANEEIVSSNEELQSTNEELQTAKEELQATNEELRTLNDEMLDRNVETTRLADDLSNILSSVAIPILILGRDSRIRRFTPTATKVLNLTAADIGRSILEVQAKVRIPDLAALLADVLERLAPLERTVQADDGRWYQLGVRPYMTLDNRIDGTILSVYDIDALKRAELLLAEARDYAESIVDTMRECLIVLDADLRVRTANRAFCQQFKTTPEAVAGERFYAIAGKQWDAPELRNLLERLAQGELVDEARFERELDGSGRRSFVATGRRMPKTGWILLTLADISERVQIDRARTEDQLARNEAGFRRMLMSAAEAIVMSDMGGRLVFANDLATRIFGYVGSEMLGLRVDDLLPPRAAGSDLVGRRKDGTELPVEITRSPMDGNDGPLVVAFVSDVSVRREAEREIKDYQARLQRMAFEAALAEERERRRIAQDLHDRVGQSLALARMKLEAVRDATIADVHTSIVTTIDLIAASIEDTRTLTFDLAPPVLYDLGLKPALSWLCEDIEKRAGVHVEIVDEGSQAPFDEATAALIFRAVRELLTNVFKHAQAPAARVVLRQVGKHFEITVEDAGAGFDVENVARRPDAGFGLFSVREQIARLGGTVAIESKPRRGTRVSVRVPLLKEGESENLRERSTTASSTGASNEDPTGG
jgi:two-component system CheB/CheR fusion protein